MKSIHKQFKRSVVDLTFRLLPSEGATPWAMAFPPQQEDSSLAPVNPGLHKKHKLLDPLDHETKKALLNDMDTVEDDIEELEEDDSEETSDIEEDADDLFDFLDYDDD